MRKSSVLRAVFTLPGSRFIKRSIYSLIHCTTDVELEQLAEYSDDPKDIAIYLADFGVYHRDITAHRALTAVSLIATDDPHNNIGRKCSQPWDINSREWVVTAYLKSGHYVLFNENNWEYRIVELKTMSSLY